MDGAGHAAYTDRFHELARLVPHLVTPENKRFERYIYGLAPQIREMPRRMEMLGWINRDLGLGGRLPQPLTLSGRSTRARHPNAQTATITIYPKTLVVRGPNCNRFRNFTKDCRVGPRMVNPLNARNPIAARRSCFECGGTDYYKAACPRLNRAPRQGEGNGQIKFLAVDGGHFDSWKHGDRGHMEVLMLGARLPPSQEIEFHIDLIPRAMLVAKSPYHLVPVSPLLNRSLQLIKDDSQDV
ncbi:hypothetical protein Tco_0533026 [Tanacetum coccineum]